MAAQETWTWIIEGAVGKFPKPRNQIALGQMRLPAALLLIGIGAVLSRCSEAATTKMDARLRTAPGNDRQIVTLIPRGSVVKLSKCAHGWCQVSWHGQTGYALAKNFGIAGLASSATETASDADEYGPDDNEESDE
jgi:uncharacterized protein YraI